VKPLCAVLASLAWTLAAWSPLAAQQPVPITFPAGAATTEIAGAVVRGGRDLRLLSAEVGQTLTARITAPENNAVFQLYLPGAQAAWRDGMLEVVGTPLPGTEEGQDARSWQGPLPVTGSYLFVIGGMRGNAGYLLSVTLR